MSLPTWEKLPPLRRCYVRLLDPDGEVFDVWQNNLEATLEGLNDHHRVFRSEKQWQEFLDSQRVIGGEWDLRNTLTERDRLFLAELKISWEPLSMRARRYQLYGKPPMSLTTEQLGEAMIQTVKQMSPSEKARLRQQLEKSVQKPAPKWMHDDFLFEEEMTKRGRLLRVSRDVLRDMKCDPRMN
jgi:hypothetical protein